MMHNPNLIGSWRDSRLIAPRTDVATKPRTPRLPDWAAAPWKAMSPPKGRSKVMSPRPPRAGQQQAPNSASPSEQGGATWIIEDCPQRRGNDVEATRKVHPERLHAATEQAIKASLRRAIDLRATLYGHELTDLATFFKALDIDESGRISIIELHKALTRLDVGVSNRQVEALLRAIDTEGDDQISIDELTLWMNKKTHTEHKKRKEQERTEADEVLKGPGSEPRRLPEIFSRRTRAPLHPADVKASDWHSPRASLTKHMGSHPKTPFNRVVDCEGQTRILRSPSNGVDFVKNLHAQAAMQKQQVRRVDFLQHCWRTVS